MVRDGRGELGGQLAHFGGARPRREGGATDDL